LSQSTCRPQKRIANGLAVSIIASAILVGARRFRFWSRATRIMCNPLSVKSASLSRLSRA
jgi:hypothetical protein